MGHWLLTVPWCVCADTNLSKHKSRGLSIFTVSFNFAFLFPILLHKKIKKNLTSVANKYIIVCSSVFCTVWDLPIAAPSRMHCRQSLEGRSHFLPPAVKYSVRPEIIWDSFQGLALFKYAGNNGQGIKWSTASHSKGSRGFESTARVSHNTIDSWSAVYSVVISYWWAYEFLPTIEIQSHTVYCHEMSQYYF